MLVFYGELPQFSPPKLENHPFWLFAIFCNIFRTTLHLWITFYSISSQSLNLVTEDLHNTYILWTLYMFSSHRHSYWNWIKCSEIVFCIMTAELTKKLVPTDQRNESYW